MILVRSFQSNASTTHNDGKLSVHLHLRSLSTNANHSKAKRGILTQSVYDVPPYELSSTIRVCQDKICVLHIAYEVAVLDQLHIWQWREGEQCFVILFSLMARLSLKIIGYTGLGMLSDPKLLLSERQTSSLLR